MRISALLLLAGALLCGAAAHSPLSPGRRALTDWTLKSALQFGFEKDPAEAGPLLSALSDDAALAEWGLHRLAEGETLAVSPLADGGLELEFVRDHGPNKKPTVIRGAYDGRGRYTQELQFPQMPDMMVFIHDKAAKPKTKGLDEDAYAANLIARENLVTARSLAARQLAEPGFKAWEHLADKHGELPSFAPRASLLGELTIAELTHLFERDRRLDQGRARIDIVYGYIGDQRLGESDPIDYDQSREVFLKLAENGFAPRKQELVEDGELTGEVGGEVLAKSMTYKGKPVEMTVRLTNSAIPNTGLIDDIDEALKDAGIVDKEPRAAVRRAILEKGKANPLEIGGPAADRINTLIERFDRKQASQSFKAKRAFEDALAGADVVVYDGHAGAGNGFAFGPFKIIWDKYFSIHLGRLRPYIHEPLKRLAKSPWVRKLLRKTPWVEDEEFYVELPFTLPRPWDAFMSTLRIDPMRMRQFLFLDACESLRHYDKLWARLLRKYQKLQSPDKFDLMGTGSDSSTEDGPLAKLSMIRAIEEGMNARQIVDALRAGAKDETEYHPGRNMGVSGEGRYEEIYGDHSRSTNPEASKLPNSKTAGFILDNNGARVKLLPPTTKLHSFDIREFTAPGR